MAMLDTPLIIQTTIEGGGAERDTPEKEVFTLLETEVSSKHGSVILQWITCFSSFCEEELFEQTDYKHFIQIVEKLMRRERGKIVKMDKIIYSSNHWIGRMPTSEELHVNNKRKKCKVAHIGFIDKNTKWD
jgi:hypothetical protein